MDDFIDWEIYYFLSDNLVPFLSVVIMVFCTRAVFDLVRWGMGYDIEVYDLSHAILFLVLLIPANYILDVYDKRRRPPPPPRRGEPRSVFCECSMYYFQIYPDDLSILENSKDAK